MAAKAEAETKSMRMTQTGRPIHETIQTYRQPWDNPHILEENSWSFVDQEAIIPEHYRRKQKSRLITRKNE